MSKPLAQIDAAKNGKASSPLFLWSVVALVFSAQMSAAFLSHGLPVLYPFIQADLGLSRTQIGLITSFLTGAGIATVMLGGWLTDVFGARKVITLMLIVSGALVVVFPLVSSFGLLLLLVALVSIADGPVYPATSKVIIDWLPGRIRGLAMSVKQTGVSVGGAASAALLPVLAMALGWRMAAALVGVLIVLVAIVFWFSYRDAPRVEKTPAALNLSALRAICSNRPLMMATVWGLVFVSLYFVLLSYILLFFIENVGVSTVAASGLLATAQVVAIGGRVAWGAASDVSVFRGRRYLSLFVIGLLATAGFVYAGFIGMGASWSTLSILAVILGLSVFSWQGVFTALIGETAEPGQIATTVGVVNTIQRVGMIIMPPLFGYLADISGTYYAGWRVAAAMALLVTLALIVFGRNPHTDT